MRTRVPSSLFASVLVGAVALTPANALAQTITDGDSTFTLPAANTTGATVRTGTTGGTAAVLMAGGNATDHLFQQWWWFRAGGGTREFGLSNRTANNASGDTLQLDYSEPEGFRAELDYVITDGANSPAAVNIAAELRIFNVTAAPLQLAVFCYLDVDLAGTTADSATLLEPGRMSITDTTGFNAEFLGVGANAYQVATFANVRINLTDADVDNFNNTGLPFGPGDFTGGYQWNLSIPQNGSAAIRAAYSLNMPADAGGSCPGDFDGNGVRDLSDLAVLLGAFGASPAGDMDGDGDTDLADLAMLLALFGAAC